MRTILSGITCGMSELMKNPESVLREAKSRPVAVLNHNKAAFYMLVPRLFEAILEELANKDLYKNVLDRFAEKVHAVEVDIDEI